MSIKANLELPFSNGKLNICKKLESTILPCTVSLFSPTLNKKFLDQLTLVACSTSGMSRSSVLANTLGVVFQHCSLPLKCARFQALLIRFFFFMKLVVAYFILYP